ncbi:redoxin domain-containing protein [Campylobacter pinnipediorum]|uniref:redoxin domain-containing protein n=1 Tax=Campylobacter pinnipediorum TaxID=1965231 RepID=UPI001E4D4546|nr:redoxin domain-containing protein [Campylobacter pinnipediorum]
MILKDIDGVEFDFSEFIKANNCVVFLYPKIGQSGKFLDDDLKNKEGMTGCTLQTKSYENLKDEFLKNNFKIVAIGSHSFEKQKAFKQEVEADFIFLNDEKFILEKELGLKTFNTNDGNKFYFRQTLVFKNSKLIHQHDVKDVQSDASQTLKFIKSL